MTLDPSQSGRRAQSDGGAGLSPGAAFVAGELIGGKYRIEGLVGEGGMGAVYAAVNEDTGRRVAVKAVLGGADGNPQAEARLLREARTVGKLAHPNIVDVYDVGQHDGVSFIVMELLTGQPLESLVSRGPMPIEDAVRLLIPAMRGVAAVHAQGVVHRDLKPENIFLCTSEAGRVRDVKVLDFGISKTYDETLATSTLTRSGTILGTPRYMAPEQLANEPVDFRADIYAIGVILYEAITGALPFEGETFAVMASNKLVANVTPLRQHLPDVSPGLEAILLRAMARDPSDRFQDVQSLATVLEPFAPGVEFGTAGIPLEITGPRLAQGPTVHLAAPGRRRPRVPWLLLGLAVVLAVVTAVAVVLLARDSPAPMSIPLEARGSPAEQVEPSTPPEVEPTHDPVGATGSDVPLAGGPELESEAGSPAVDPSPVRPDKRPGTMRSGAGAPGRTGRLRIEDF